VGLRRALVIGLLALTGGSAVHAQDKSAEMIATALVEGDQPVKVELLIHKPAGTGPFPAVVFNHGSTGRGDNPALFRHSWSSAAIDRYFTERGWMVIYPQRRGRGRSQGLYDEGFEPDRSRYSCTPSLALAGVDRAIADLDAVMPHIRGRPDVIGGRLLIAGVSRGGILAIAYAGERPDVFVGAINFVGGWMSDRCATASQINGPAFGRGGVFARPTLWLYGDADPFYALSHSRSNFEAFVAAGGKGRFETYWVPGQNSGHALHAHPALWSGAVDAYLKSIP
jgi:dienelactone hydrolase